MVFYLFVLLFSVALRAKSCYPTSNITSHLVNQTAGTARSPRRTCFLTTKARSHAFSQRILNATRLSHSDILNFYPHSRNSFRTITTFSSLATRQPHRPHHKSPYIQSSDQKDHHALRFTVMIRCDKGRRKGLA